jgi:hypothetical protein
MLQKDVMKFLDSHLGKSGFLTTGVMTAHGATVSSVHKTESSLNAKLGFSGAPEATVGPELEASNPKKSGVVYEYIQWNENSYIRLDWQRLLSASSARRMAPD